MTPKDKAALLPEVIYARLNETNSIGYWHVYQSAVEGYPEKKYVRDDIVAEKDRIIASLTAQKHFAEKALADRAPLTQSGEIEEVMQEIRSDKNFKSPWDRPFTLPYVDWWNLTSRIASQRRELKELNKQLAFYKKEREALAILKKE